ncbi:uncharacterized protein LOC132717525 [Ruditapes philippinarum]|uniref:uncharacterized protein LOC132717525 n=1 Tax=Ruditapes philippinarum TaxID=129788 RepID=UPI00295C2978|nr:uncharacterized protein LOC132717525 [Ruditapes philippinarum]
MKLIWLCLILLQIERALAVLSNDERDVAITYYYGKGYTYKEICGFLLFSHNTIVSLRQLKRILKRLRLRRRNVPISLPDIIHALSNILERGFGECGYRTVWKLIKSSTTVHVTQDIVRRLLRICDPEGVNLRARHRLRRRTYTNRGPNYAIHLDGYDKLKPFGIGIHGAIDGYSRKLLWLEACYTNNNPHIIAGYYLTFLKRIGRVPRLVRGDAGTENVIVRDIQVALRYEHSDNMAAVNSFLTGTSPSNQRIEQFWGTLRASFSVFWRNHFKDMTDRGMLNMDDRIHLEVLRFCFLPIIQRDLDKFTQVWNLHRIRRQRNSEVPSGIPDVLYHQPEVFHSYDHSLPLPCNVEVITRIQNDYAKAKPKFGCKDEFLPILEEVCGLPTDQIPRPKTVDLATDLFCAITEIINDF